jgi:hypothetical protein
VDAGAGRPVERPVLEWLRARARVQPGALDELPGAARRAYEHEWAPVESLGRLLDCLPAGLWRTLLQWESGYAVLDAGESRYEPGEFDFRGRTLRGGALVSLVDLAGRDPSRVLHAIGHLVDHHLGCGGAEEGVWLSEGGGVMPAWREAGRRLPRLFDLGYGFDEIALSGVRDYFAQSLAAYCRERPALTVADPQIARWFRTTLWSPGFWRQKRAVSDTVS